jgi:hypothetical protein
MSDPLQFVDRWQPCRPRQGRTFRNDRSFALYLSNDVDKLKCVGQTARLHFVFLRFVSFRGSFAVSTL